MAEFSFATLLPAGINFLRIQLKPERPSAFLTGQMWIIIRTMGNNIDGSLG